MNGRYVWTYDQLGREVNEQYVYGYREGYLSHRLRNTQYLYDDLGNKLAIIREYSILDDGSIEEHSIYYDLYTYTYDPDGNLIRSEYNEGNDSDVEDIWEYTYRADGKLAKEERDRYADGDIDTIITHIYDEDGDLVKSYDRSTASGAYWVRTTYTYDENGCLVMRETDRWEDSFLDSFAVYTCDQHANPLTESYELCVAVLDGSICEEPKPRREYSYIYDSNANMLVKECRNSHGSIEYRYHYAYYPDGNTSMEEHHDCFSTATPSWRMPNPQWPGWWTSLR